MPYSVMIWLKGASEDSPEAGAARESASAAAGVTTGPLFTHLSYGFFESPKDLDEALARLSEQLRQGVVRVVRDGRTFLIPTSRIHYVVADEVERPIDR